MYCASYASSQHHVMPKLQPEDPILVLSGAASHSCPWNTNQIGIYRCEMVPEWLYIKALLALHDIAIPRIMASTSEQMSTSCQQRGVST